MTSSLNESCWDRLSRSDTIASSSKRGNSNEGNLVDNSSLSSFCSQGTTTTTTNTRTCNDNSKRKTTNQFFDRLSKTETYATADTKGKIDRSSTTMNKKTIEKKTTHDFFDRMSKTDTYASRDMKNNNNVVLTKPKSKPHISPHHQTRKTTDSFFDRLSKKETYASAGGKGLISSSTAKSQISKNITTPTINSSTKKKTKNVFFDNLSRTETYATADAKGRIKKDEVIKSNTTAPRNKTSCAFFERMSIAETYASRDMKGKHMY